MSSSSEITDWKEKNRLKKIQAIKAAASNGTIGDLTVDQRVSYEVVKFMDEAREKRPKKGKAAKPKWKPKPKPKTAKVIYFGNLEYIRPDPNAKNYETRSGNATALYNMWRKHQLRSKKNFPSAAHETIRAFQASGSDRFIYLGTQLAAITLFMTPDDIDELIALMDVCEYCEIGREFQDRLLNDVAAVLFETADDLNQNVLRYVLQDVGIAKAIIKVAQMTKTKKKEIENKDTLCVEFSCTPERVPVLVAESAFHLLSLITRDVLRIAFYEVIAITNTEEDDKTLVESANVLYSKWKKARANEMQVEPGSEKNRNDSVFHVL